MRPREFRRFLAASLDRMAVEAPEAYARLGEQLARLPLALEVDGERSLLRFEAGRHRLEEDGPARASLRTSSAGILDLVDGRTSLVESIQTEALWLQGRPQALIEFDAALTTYLAGAVRAPAFPQLLADYRRRPAPPRS